MGREEEGVAQGDVEAEVMREVEEGSVLDEDLAGQDYT